MGTRLGRGAESRRRRSDLLDGSKPNVILLPMHDRARRGVAVVAVAAAVTAGVTAWADGVRDVFVLAAVDATAADSFPAAFDERSRILRIQRRLRQLGLYRAPLDGRVNGDGALTCVATNSRTPTINLREICIRKVPQEKVV